MTNSEYNAHTKPLLIELKLLKIKDIFDLQCMKFWYNFVNGTVPAFFASMFQYNHKIYEIGTRNHHSLHLYPVRTISAEEISCIEAKNDRLLEALITKYDGNNCNLLD